MKLRSKFTLLLLVGALLLAAPAMALMTDMGPNILPASWTSQSDKANIDAPGANQGAKPGGNPSGNPSANTSPEIQGGQSDVADPSASTSPVQKIWSNKDDYAPGARVTLSGSYWQPGESIRIDVNDDQGKSWSRKVEVRADASGRIQYQFQLPEWLVGTYEVTAMGEHSGVATTSFTQGNVTFGATSPAPASRRVSLSRDPSATNGNITGPNTHFESAKQAPEAQPQLVVSTEEEAAKTITLIATDEEGDNLSFFIVTPPNHGTLGPIGALTCAGTAPRICSTNVTYTPDEDYNGFDIFSFKASDATEESYPAPVSILVDPLNGTPVSTDETKTMSEDGGPLSIDFGALLSDVETSDANLTYNITTPDPAKGSLGGEGSTRTFTPAADFNGSVDIGYTVADRGDPDNCSEANPPCAAAKISAQKSVSVTVEAVNDAPSFQKGSDQTVNEDAGTQTIDGWATDISAGPADENGQQLTFEVTNDTNNLFTSGGQPAIDASGKLTYETAPNANGSATVSVKAHDDGGTPNGGADTSAEQSFTIAVGAVNDAPIADTDTMATDEDTKLLFPSGDLVGNDAEGADNESSQSMSVTEVYEGTHGTVSLGTDGNITFTPEVDFSGDATFRYLVCDDASPSKCSVQRAAVNVSAVNDAPLADDKSLTTDEDAAREVVLSASDVESDALGYTIVSAPEHGTLSVRGANLTYTPDADYNGPDSFTFKASDGTADSDPATVNIAVNAVNDAPVATNDTFSTSEDTPLVLPATQLLGNDDPGAANESGQTLMITAVEKALNGQVSLGTNGDITFTPATDFIGLASFEYTICDNGSPSECSETVAIVNVTMSQLNEAPSFTAGEDQTVAEDSGAHSIPGWASGISAGPAEESGQALAFQVSNTNTELFSAQPEVTPEGKLTYTLAANASGSADVSVRLEDNGGITNGGVDKSPEQTFTINVTAVNDNPVISAVSNSSGPVDEGSPTTITVNATDVDNPSGDLRYSFDCDNNNAFETDSQTANSSSCTFNDNGTRRVNVRVTDGPAGGSATGFTNVVVNNVAPTIIGITASPLQALIGQPVSFSGTATDSSSADTTAGFAWRWSKDGGAYAAGSNPFSTSFSTCGSHSVSAKATDKAGSTSAAATTSTSVEVYNGTFLEPLKGGTDNLVQKGQIVPVNISVAGCDGINRTGLLPDIRLLGGDPTPSTNEADFTVPTTSVPVADSSGLMRQVSDGYIYNLQVPNGTSVKSGDKYYIRVSPFGIASDQHMIISLEISK